ncbi:MAG: FAD:protein FMN transferase [Pyrinomonadaceae bacterium]|nr:FAD:protein FMN transferase [Phycisphaerales bacterium]
MSCCFFLLWVAAWALLQTGCAGEQNLERYEFTRVSMGVPARILLYARNQQSAMDAAAAAFERIASLDDCMSDYRPTSELMRLCARAGGPAQHVSEDLFRILSQACEISQASDGAFDVTVGPMVRLWRAARTSRVPPTPGDILAARDLVGWEKIVLNPSTRTARLNGAGMALDLGGIAKGYAAHQAVELLKSGGHPRCLVSMSGDISAGDSPPGTSGWEVQIGLPPVHGVDSRHIQVLVLSNASVSTSGDTQQFVELAGVRYSHIVDPRTGMGATNRTMCTVVAREGSAADGYSSAACVMGAEAAVAMFARVQNIAAIVWTDIQSGEAPRIHDPRGILRLSTQPMEQMSGPGR